MTTKTDLYLSKGWARIVLRTLLVSRLLPHS
jgi:hypothetical protein